MYKLIVGHLPRTTQIDATNWAVVQTNGYVTIQATLSDSNGASRIKWSGGGQAVPGNPLQWQVSAATSKEWTITASLASTNLSLNVWVIWATVRIQMNDTNPAPEPARFNSSEDGTELLGIRYFDNSNSVAGKICGVATLTPVGIHSLITKGWGFQQMVWSTLLTNGVVSTINPPWTNDTAYWWWQSMTPDNTDKIYTIDGPALEPSNAPSGIISLATYKNFYNFVTWNSQTCSDTNNFWHFQAAWATNQSPMFNSVDLNTNLITIP